MVKDNKFAASPSADGTADAKKDRNVTKVTTTENVVQPKEQPKTDKRLEEASGSKEDKMYAAYVKGDSIQSIADHYGVDAADVLAVVEKTESERK